MHLRTTWVTVFVLIYYMLGLFTVLIPGLIIAIIPEADWDVVLIPRSAIIHIQLAGIGSLLAGILLCLFEAYKDNPRNWKYSNRDLELMEQLRKCAEDYDEHKWDAVNALLRNSRTQSQQSRHDE